MEYAMWCLGQPGGWSRSCTKKQTKYACCHQNVFYYGCILDCRNSFIFLKLACWSKQYLQRHLLFSTHKFLAGMCLLNKFGFILTWKRPPLFWHVYLRRVLANLSTWCGWKFTHTLQTNKNMRNLKWRNFIYFINSYTSLISWFTNYIFFIQP